MELELRESPQALAEGRIYGELTPVGWIPPEGGMTFEEWQETGDTLTRINTATKFARGDWLAYGEGRGQWGETYAQAMDQTSMSYDTLRQERYVAERVPIRVRVHDLGWSHHYAVARLEPEQQREMLERAKREGWSRETLRDAVRGGGEVARAVRSPFEIWSQSLHGLHHLISSLEYSGVEEVGGMWDREGRRGFAEELRRITGLLEGYATTLEGMDVVETRSEWVVCECCDGHGTMEREVPVTMSVAEYNRRQDGR